MTSILANTVSCNTDLKTRGGRGGGGGGGTPYNGLYGEAPSERGTIFMLPVYERVEISRVEENERVEISRVEVCI